MSTISFSLSLHPAVFITCDFLLDTALPKQTDITDNFFNNFDNSYGSTMDKVSRHQVRKEETEGNSKSYIETNLLI